jgi:hypothetical protein
MKHLKKFNENMYDDHMRQEQENDPNWGKTKDDKAKDYIITKFKQRFAGKKPDAQEFAELYHDLRTEKINGILIFDTLEEAGLYSVLKELGYK